MMNRNPARWVLLVLFLLAVAALPAVAQDSGDDELPELSEVFSDGNLQFHYPEDWVIIPEVLENGNVVVQFGSNQAAIDENIIPAGEVFGIIITLDNPTAVTDIDVVGPAMQGLVQQAFGIELSDVETKAIGEDERAVAVATWEEPAGDGAMYAWAADEQTAVIVLYVVAGGERRAMSPLLEWFIADMAAGEVIASITDAVEDVSDSQDGVISPEGTIAGYYFVLPDDWVTLDVPEEMGDTNMAFASDEEIGEELQVLLDDGDDQTTVSVSEGKAALLTIFLALPEGFSLTEEDFVTMFGTPPQIPDMEIGESELVTIGDYPVLRAPFQSEESDGWLYTVLLNESSVLNMLLYSAVGERDDWQEMAEAFIASLTLEPPEESE